jgi:carbonic anhydrase
MNVPRRLVIGSAAVAAFMKASAADAEISCIPFTAERQRDITPDAALQLLKDGNARFMADKSINCDLLAQVHATAGGQAPFAAILGCIDSRVPPELVFDQRIGDVFTARIAGNFVNVDILGSLEYSCKVIGAKLIVVLGHTDCGAIKGAIDQVKLGNLTEMLRNFAPAIAAARIPPGERTSKNKAIVQAVADNNAKLAARMIMTRSPVLRAMVEKKEVLIASAMHDVSTGRITFFA